jgi:hypothetical protein
MNVFLLFHSKEQTPTSVYAHAAPIFGLISAVSLTLLLVLARKFSKRPFLTQRTEEGERERHIDLLAPKR